MEAYSLIRALLALLLVVGMVLALGWAMRRWDIQKLAGKMQEGRRLRVREQLHLDAKRKVVLFSCDEKEYLLVLGMQSEQVIALAESKGEAI